MSVSIKVLPRSEAELAYASETDLNGALFTSSGSNLPSNRDSPVAEEAERVVLETLLVDDEEVE